MNEIHHDLELQHRQLNIPSKRSKTESKGEIECKRVAEKIFNKQSFKDFYIISEGTHIPRYYKTYKSKKKDWNKIKDIILLYFAKYTDKTYEDNYKDDDEYYSNSFIIYNNILTNYEPLIVPNIINNFTKESYLYNLTFYNNFDLIKKIPEADLHKVFNENINLLYYAISKKSNEDIINYLLDKNLDVNLITLDGNENVLMFSIIYDMPIDIITKIFDKTSDFSLINTEDKNLYDITLESKHSNKFDILRLIATKIQYTNKLNKTLIIKAIEVLNNSETILFDNLLKTIFAREDYEKSDHNRNNIFFHYKN